MTALRSIARGLQNGLRLPGLLLTLYVINLAVALPGAMVFRSLLRSTFGDSMAIERFLDGFDYTAYQDFLTQAGPALGTFFMGLFWILMAYMLVSTLIAGGILSIAAQKPPKFSLGEFFGGCGRFFGRFFRLFVIFALVILVIMAVVGAILAGVFSLATENADSEVLLVIWGVLVGSVGVGVLGFLLVTLDYAKVVTVRFDGRSMIKATGQAFGFVFRHLFSVKLSILLIVLVLAAGTAAYLWIASEVGMDSDLALAVVFVVQQVYVLFRIYLRVSFYDCELEIHQQFAYLPGQPRALDAEPAEVPGA